jgi:hypothetical protein
MLERAVSDTHPFSVTSIFVYTVHTLIRGISMVAPAKQSKHYERSQWTARDIGYVLAKLALARVVTRDMAVSQNKNFGRNPSLSCVKPVVTRGSTVQINAKCFDIWPILLYCKCKTRSKHVWTVFLYGDSIPSVVISYIAGAMARKDR